MVDLGIRLKQFALLDRQWIESPQIGPEDPFRPSVWQHQDLAMHPSCRLGFDINFTICENMHLQSAIVGCLSLPNTIDEEIMLVDVHLHA